mgnify:FL=1
MKESNHRLFDFNSIILNGIYAPVWYFAVLGVNTPFKFAVFVCEWAAPLPGIKGDKDLDRPWGQISQNKSENDKKKKIVQRSQLCDHLVGRRESVKESGEVHRWI